MDVDARLEALEADNERLRDELDALKGSLGMTFRAPAEWCLTGKETLIFGRLLRGGMCTKDALMSALYRDTGQDEPEIKIIDVFVCKLRKKIKPFGLEIRTIWGLGYEMLPASRALYEATWPRAANAAEADAA